MEKIRLKLKAYDHRVLDRSVAAIVEAVKRTGAEIVGPISRIVAMSFVSQGVECYSCLPKTAWPPTSMTSSLQGYLNGKN